MSEISVPKESEPKLPVVLFRGIARGHDGRERLGAWWATDPFYAIGVAQGSPNVYVAVVSETDLSEIAEDSTTKGPGFYYFTSEDPPGARKITAEERVAIKHGVQLVSYEDLGINNPPMGDGFERIFPQDRAEFARSIFVPSSTDMGELPDTFHSNPANQ